MMARIQRHNWPVWASDRRSRRVRCSTYFGQYPETGEQLRFVKGFTERGPRPSKARYSANRSLVVAGIALLAAGAEATVSGASDLARLLGWSDRLIGLTIVSAGSGLPEVVASLVSSVRGRSDIAIGNVIGSNLFNSLAILGLSAMAAPFAGSAGVGGEGLLVDARNDDPAVPHHAERVADQPVERRLASDRRRGLHRLNVHRMMQ